MGPGRAGMAPTSGPGWVRNTVKQSTWRIWTGPPRTRDGTWTGQDGTQARVWMAPPRDSSRLVGLSEMPISFQSSAYFFQFPVNSGEGGGFPSSGPLWLRQLTRTSKVATFCTRAQVPTLSHPIRQQHQVQ